MTHTKRTPELVLEAKRLRAEGFSWAAIGNKLGVSKTSAHEWGDETYHKRNRIRHYAERKTVTLHSVKGKRPDRIDDASLPPIPPDTHNLTARLCGDPIPGRSALDKVRK